VPDAERLQGGDRLARNRQIRGASGEYCNEPAGRGQCTDDHGAPDRVGHDRLSWESARRPAQHALGAPGSQRGEPGFPAPLCGQQPQRLLLSLAIGEDDLGHGGASGTVQIQAGDTAHLADPITGPGCAGWVLPWMRPGVLR
jgi:hypothetical protein